MESISRVSTLITIRKARLADMELLQRFEKQFGRDLRNSVLQRAPKLRPYLKRPAARGTTFAKWTRKWLRSRNALMLIAEKQSKPIGFSASWIENNPPYLLPARFGYVGYLFVRANYRGQGVSSRMMEETLRWFAMRKIRHVSLTVVEGNEPARSIYRKWGFLDFSMFTWKSLSKSGRALRSR